MATNNYDGLFKYKQDNGDIVELIPVGVDTEARTLATNEATRAKAAEQKLENDKADKSAIPDVSALVTKVTYDAGQAAQDAKIAALKAVEPDILPYLFDSITISSIAFANRAVTVAELFVDLPWIHSQCHTLKASLSGSPFYVVNLRDGTVQTVTDNISLFATCAPDIPYHLLVQIRFSASFAANTPYLVAISNASIVISE